MASAPETCTHGVGVDFPGVSSTRSHREVGTAQLTRAAPNKGMEPIAYSLRFAAASGNGSCLALGARGAGKKPEESGEDRVYNAYTAQ